MQGTKMERYERKYGRATYGIRERVETLEANLRVRRAITENVGARTNGGPESDLRAQWELAVAIEDSVREELADARAALIEVSAAGAVA